MYFEQTRTTQGYAYFRADKPEWYDVEISPGLPSGASNSPFDIVWEATTEREKRIFVPAGKMNNYREGTVASGFQSFELSDQFRNDFVDWYIDDDTSSLPEVVTPIPSGCWDLGCSPY